MAKIIENNLGRRIIRLNTSDIINVVREYQNISINIDNYEQTRKILDNFEMFLPEDLY